MNYYYVNKNAQSTGEHEVHKRGCFAMPQESNAHYLGYFSSCTEAVKQASRFYSNVDGCYHCSIACHTR